MHGNNDNYTNSDNQENRNPSENSTTANSNRVNIGRDGDTYYRGTTTRDRNGNVISALHAVKPFGQSSLSNSK